MNELIELMKKFSKENNMQTAINVDITSEGNIREIYFSHLDPGDGINWQHSRFFSTEKAIEGIKALINLKKATV